MWVWGGVITRQDKACSYSAGDVKALLSGTLAVSWSRQQACVLYWTVLLGFNGNPLLKPKVVMHDCSDSYCVGVQVNRTARTSRENIERLGYKLLVGL